MDKKYTLKVVGIIESGHKLILQLYHHTDEGMVSSSNLPINKKDGEGIKVGDKMDITLSIKK